jgi:transposase
VHLKDFRGVIHAATGSPIAKEALDRIGQLYSVEKTINGSPPERRRQQRQLQSKPIAEALAGLGRADPAPALPQVRARPGLPLYAGALVRCFEDGRLALDNNPAERALRCVAIGRKNYLFAGSDAGGRRAAAIYSLIESAKLNGRNPQHYLADVLARIAELLPWNWQPLDATRAAARAGPLTERLRSTSFLVRRSNFPGKRTFAVVSTAGKIMRSACMFSRPRR